MMLKTRRNSATPHVDLLEKRIRSSRRALLIERIWPRIWPPLVVALAFVLVSLLGLWTVLEPTAHIVALGGFALLLLASLVPLVRITRPSRDEAVRRLEKKSDIPHRPASAYDDTLTPSGNAAADRRAETLWQAHRDRLAGMFGRLRSGTPQPRVDRHDPLALRAALILTTVIAALFVWPSAGERLLSAFRDARTSEILEARIDAWVTPPHYTGKAPIMLADGSVVQKADSDEARMFEVPAGSALIVRTVGLDRNDVSVTYRLDGETDTTPLEEKADDKSNSNASGQAPTGLSEFRHTLKQDGVLSLSIKDSRLKGWQFQVTPDNPPEIKLTKKPGQSARAALALNYRVTDDYGVTGAEATFALTDKSRDAVGLIAKQGADEYENLWPAPKFPLRLPRRNSKKTDARAYQDLTAHHWAGLEVAMTLSARDQARQIGRSEPYVFKLPARNFTKPMAKAVVEQRRKLAIDPSSHARVATAIDGITIGAELFIQNPSVYLGLRSVYWRLAHHDWSVPGSKSSEDARKRTNDVLKSLVDQMWDIALTIEDGDLSQAERDLRDAQDRLAQALKDGASPEEISKLTKELREAMNRFLRSMQRQAQQQGQQQRQAQNPNARNQQLSQRDLNKMLQDIEKLANSGSREAAQQMLDQLRNMLEQLQTAQGNPQSGRMQQTVKEFGDLIRDQQRLLDDTFNARQGRRGRDGKRGQRRGQRGQQGEGEQGQEGSGRSNELSRRQGDLRNNLGRLLDSLEGFGAQMPQQLKDAQRAMQDAQQSLEKEDLDRATRRQSQALDQLRQGTRQMAEEMLRGVAGQVGRRPRDPLGRGQESQNDGTQAGDDVKVPGEIDVQKARRILEELRRRASDPNRPSLELDYIERLLERF